MKNVKNKKNLLMVFVIILTSFLIWVIFSFSIKKNITHNLWKSDFYVNCEDWAHYEWGINLAKFLEAYSYLKKEYYDSSIINEKDIIESAIKWMVDWLWDKHSEYLTKTQTKTFNDTLSWDFEWIWAVVKKVELGVQIDRIIKGSPAKESWLLQWDILTEANGTRLVDLELYEAVSYIKWPAGTKVLLKILRKGEEWFIEKEVTRNIIVIPSVESKILDKDKNIWYIAINMFWDNTEDEFQEAFESLKDTSWLIIDIRDNGGGYLQSAVMILSNFIENGKEIVFTKYKNVFYNNKYTSVNETWTYKWKIVVLINENSASASEITAWALRDYRKAILVWKKTYWKWSVQQPFTLKDWWMLKLTIARWFTPKNKNIDNEWIKPDIEVIFQKEDIENKYDRQLEEWKKILDHFIQYDSLQLSIDRYNMNNSQK